MYVRIYLKYDVFHANLSFNVCNSIKSITHLIDKSQKFGRKFINYRRIKKPICPYVVQ